MVSLRRVVFVIACLIETGLTSEERPLVLVSVPPYLSVVQEIAGESINVEAIVPPNSSFHSFDPTPKKIHFFRQAKLVFTVGEPFEHKIQEALQQQKNPLVIVDLRTGLPSVKSHADPHIWTSP